MTGGDESAGQTVSIIHRPYGAACREPIRRGHCFGSVDSLPAPHPNLSIIVVPGSQGKLIDYTYVYSRNDKIHGRRWCSWTRDRPTDWYQPRLGATYTSQADSLPPPTHTEQDIMDGDIPISATLTLITHPV